MSSQTAAGKLAYVKAYTFDKHSLRGIRARFTIAGRHTLLIVQSRGGIAHLAYSIHLRVLPPVQLQVLHFGYMRSHGSVYTRASCANKYAYIVRRPFRIWNADRTTIRTTTTRKHYSSREKVKKAPRSILRYHVFTSRPRWLRYTQKNESRFSIDGERTNVNIEEQHVIVSHLNPRII